MNEYPHMCRMDHQEIGHSDSEHEQCPLCRANSRIEELEAKTPSDWLLDNAVLRTENKELQHKYEATREGLEEALYMLGVIDLDGNVTEEYFDPDPDAMRPGVRRAIRALLDE